MPELMHGHPGPLATAAHCAALDLPGPAELGALTVDEAGEVLRRAEAAGASLADPENRRGYPLPS
jgi:hypothetical protein